MAASLRLPRLRADQYEVVSDTHKVRVCACGRRWGKSTAGRVATLIAASQGFPVLWCAPLFKNTVPLWVEAKRSVKELRAAGLVRISENDKTIEFNSNGGRLEIHSAESADGILGNSYALAVVDEAAKVSEYVIQEVIWPCVSDFDGEILLLGSPKGVSNLFYQLWQRGMDGDPDIKSWRYPTTDNPNPKIQKAVERARAIMPEMKFRQEFLAEFLTDGTGVFVNLDACITAKPQKQAIEGHFYVCGVDWGKSNDWTVICVYDVTLKAIVEVVRINQIEYSRQRAYVHDVNQRFSPKVFLCESNSIGDPIIDQLKREGLSIQPFYMTAVTKNELVDQFALALANEAVKLINHPQLVSELRAYSGKQPKSGALWQYNAPPGLHDDCVVSAMLAYHAGNEPERVTKITANPFYTD